MQEQLNNTIKFSQAKNVHITLQHTNQFLELIIKDDGVGFDTAKNITGVGLQNITTRADIHNGKVMLKSAPFKGCMLKVVFPI